MSVYVYLYDLRQLIIIKTNNEQYRWEKVYNVAESCDKSKLDILSFKHNDDARSLVTWIFITSAMQWIICSLVTPI